jgi:choline dehydrogenase-like flavoprotein
MATELRRTDVVVIGLGATGGVAALPLAQAGIDVVGLEAGTWLAAADTRPTTAQQLPRLAALGPEDQSRDSPRTARPPRRRTHRACRSIR